MDSDVPVDDAAVLALGSYGVAFLSAASVFDAAIATLALALPLIAMAIGAVAIVGVGGELALYGALCYLFVVAAAVVLWQLMRHHALARREASRQCFDDLTGLLRGDPAGPYSGATGAVLEHAVRRRISALRATGRDGTWLLPLVLLPAEAGDPFVFIDARADEQVARGGGR